MVNGNLKNNASAFYFFLLEINVIGPRMARMELVCDLKTGASSSVVS